MSSSLPVLTGAVSCYPALMVNFIWFTDKNVHCIGTKQHGGMKSSVSQSQNSTISQAVCMQVHCLAGRCKIELSPKVRESDRFGRFCGCNGKTSTVCQ